MKRNAVPDWLVRRWHSRSLGLVRRTDCPRARSSGLMAMLATVSDCALLATAPSAAVTLTERAGRQRGTTTRSCVAVALVTLPRKPLNRTVFSSGVVLKLLPAIVTVSPALVLVGVTPVIAGLRTARASKRG